MTNNKKYLITNITHPDYFWLHRIQALRDIGDAVKQGDLGGYVESEHNLDAWDNDESWLFDDSIACCDATVRRNSILKDNAIAKDNAHVSVCAHMSGNSIAEDHVRISGASMYQCSRVSGNGEVVTDKEDKYAPELWGNTCVYGGIHGNVRLDGNTLILPGEKIDNACIDRVLIINGERSMERADGRSIPQSRFPRFGAPDKKQIQEANIALDNYDHWLVSHGRSLYLSEFSDNQSLSDQEALAALELGIRIGISDATPIPHGIHKDCYCYSIINTPNDILHPQRYGQYNDGTIMIDPAYDFVSVSTGVSCIHLKNACMLEVEKKKVYPAPVKHDKKVKRRDDAR